MPRWCEREGVPGTALRRCPQLLKRLLEERRPRVELVLQERDVPPAHGSGTAEPKGSGSRCGLGERWDRLMEEAEDRWVVPQTLDSGSAAP